MHSSRVRLGELLVKSALLSQQQLDETLSLQSQDGRRLGTLLVETGLISETQVTQILSQQLSVPWVSLIHIDFSRELLELVPREVVVNYCLIPIYVRRVRGLGETLYVAMDDPTNSTALSEVSQYSGLQVRAMIAPPSDIRRAIQEHYGIPPREPPGSIRTRPMEETSEVAGSSPPTEVDSKPSGPPSSVAEASQASDARNSAARASEPAPDSRVLEEATLQSPATADQGGMLPPPNTAGRTGSKKRPGPASLLSLTLLDGTTVRLPRGGTSPEAAAASDSDGLTTKDLVAALRAMSHGVDATEMVGKEVRWESLFAALLSLLLRKHLISDWEFIEEYEKSSGE